MNEQEKDYVRTNPDGLSRKELAAKFGVSVDTIAGVLKKRRRHEVDLEKWPAEVNFIRENAGKLSDSQLQEAIGRLTGRLPSIWWITRVRCKLQESHHSVDAKTSESREGPFASLVFGEL